MPASLKNIIRSALRMSLWLAAAALLTGSLIYAEVLISSQYSLSAPVMAGGGANTVSPNYMIRTGILGQAVEPAEKIIAVILISMAYMKTRSKTNASGKAEPTTSQRKFRAEEKWRSRT